MISRLVMKCHIVKPQTEIDRSEQPTALDRADPVLKRAVRRVVFGTVVDKW
jgi:hypothetical protein